MTLQRSTKIGRDLKETVAQLIASGALASADLEDQDGLHRVAQTVANVVGALLGEAINSAIDDLLSELPPHPAFMYEIAHTLAAQSACVVLSCVVEGLDGDEVERVSVSSATEFIHNIVAKHQPDVVAMIERFEPKDEEKKT